MSGSGRTLTDNKSLASKIAIRLETLKRAGLQQQPLRVLDLCAGAGRIWSEMRRHVNVEAYTPVDREPRLAGTIGGDVMDRRVVISLRPETYNVIDVDTYGEPWVPWSYCAERLTQRTAVFLTHGCAGTAPGLSSYAWRAMGIPPEWKPPKKLLLVYLSELYCLNVSRGSVRLALALRSRPSARVSYWGLIAEPARRAASRRRA